MENWHLQKTELKTDEELEFDETIIQENKLKDIGMEITEDPYQTEGNSVAEQIRAISNNFKLHSDFVKEQEEESQRDLERLLRDNPVARKAYTKEYHVSEDELFDANYYDMTSDIDAFYGDNSKNKVSKLQQQFNNISNLR